MAEFIKLFATTLLILAHASALAETQVQYHQVMDPQRGVAQAAFPFPASWQINDEHAAASAYGSGGVHLYPANTKQFFWSDDPS